MKWDDIIQNGEIVTPTTQYTANIYIKDGKIAAITEESLSGEDNRCRRSVCAAGIIGHAYSFT